MQSMTQNQTHKTIEGGRRIPEVSPIPFKAKNTQLKASQRVFLFPWKGWP